MPMTRAQFIALMEPQFLDKIWHGGEDKVEPIGMRLVNVGDFGSKMFIDDMKMGGFGALQNIAEGGPVTYDEALTPVQKRYQYVVRGLGYQITDRLIRDEQYGQVMQLEGDLKDANDDDIETFIAALYNNATATTISTGFDGLALASTAHTRLDGGATQANRPSSLGALDVATLTTGLVQFNKWVNDRGRPIRSKPAKLIVTPDLEPTAREILESQQRPDTANNTTNIISRYGLELVVWRYLTGTTFWGLLGDKHGINFKWKFRPETSSEEDFDTKVVKRQVRWGGGRGHSKWEGFYLGNT